MTHLSLISGANILAIFPAPSYSHTIASKILCRTLADRGHQIYLITTDPRPMDHPNITQIDLSFSYKMWEDGFDFVWYKENNIGIEVMIKSFATTIAKVLERQLNSTGDYLEGLKISSISFSSQQVFNI